MAQLPAQSYWNPTSKVEQTIRMDMNRWRARKRENCHSQKHILITHYATYFGGRNAQISAWKHKATWYLWLSTWHLRNASIFTYFMKGVQLCRKTSKLLSETWYQLARMIPDKHIQQGHWFICMLYHALLHPFLVVHTTWEKAYHNTYIQGHIGRHRYQLTMYVLIVSLLCMLIFKMIMNLLFFCWKSPDKSLMSHFLLACSFIVFHTANHHMNVLKNIETITTLICIMYIFFISMPVSTYVGLPISTSPVPELGVNILPVLNLWYILPCLSTVSLFPAKWPFGNFYWCWNNVYLGIWTAQFPNWDIHSIHSGPSTIPVLELSEFPPAGAPPVISLLVPQLRLFWVEVEDTA